MRILVTGAAGFIGFHLSKRLLDGGYEIVGLDNLNAYYDVQLKIDRLAILKNYPAFRFHVLDLADRQGIAELFDAEKPEIVVNLAAQAGVRYSLENPHGLHEYPGGMQAQCGKASRLCVVEFRLRCEHGNALFRASQC